jgi:dTDP-glucose 4,6-dehydratase
VPIFEEHPLTPQSPYSATKIAADQIALSFWHAFSTPVVVIRPFNTYGPRQSARAVIPTIITQIANGRHTIHLGSLRPTRDFSYVRDTVGGFIAALESDEGLGEVINLGSGFEISIGDTLSLIAELMQVEVQVEEENERLRPAGSEVYRLLADNSKAKRLFNWEPRYAQLEGFRRGLSETIPWFTNPENLNEYKPDKYNL